MGISKHFMRAGAAALALLLAQEAGAVYQNVSVTGIQPNKIKKFSLALPGKKPKPQPLVTRQTCQQEPGGCGGPGELFVQTEQPLPPATTGTVVVTDTNDVEITGTFEVRADGSIDVRLAGAPSTPAAPGTLPPVGAVPGTAPTPIAWSPLGPGPSVKLGVRYRETELGNNNAATGTVIRGPGNEIGIAFAPRTYSGPQYELEVDDIGSVDLGGWRFLTSFAAWYFDPDDEQSSSQVPVGGDPVAITYPYPAPNGSTGLGLGATGANVKIRSDYDEWGAALRFAGDPQEWVGTGWQWRPTVGLRYENREQDISGQFRSPTFGSFLYMDNDQNLEDQAIYLPLGVELSTRVADRARLIVGLSVAPGYYWSEMGGSMHVVSPAAPPEDNIRLNYDDDDSGFTWRFDARIGLEAPIADKIALLAAASWGYNDHVAVADNRENPSDGRTKLSSDSQTDWTVGIGIRVTF